MQCVGIFIDERAVVSTFNPELLINQGHSMILSHRHNGSPEFLRDLVERGLRRSSPHVTLRFIDAYSDLMIEQPKNDYALLICQDAPMYSAGRH